MVEKCSLLTPDSSFFTSPTKKLFIKGFLSVHPLRGLFLLVFFWIGGCASLSYQEQQGVLTGYEGFVPVRTLVMPCQLWPTIAVVENIPATNADAETLKKACGSVDSFVIEGFKAQPYMQGYTPAAIDKKMKAKNKSDFIATGMKEWTQLVPGEKSFDPAMFYQKNLLKQASWIKWLNELSTDIQYADGLLLPFVSHLYERVRLDDQGRYQAERGGGVLLMLIDTNNGRLIWTQRKSSQIQVSIADPKAPPVYPPWESLFTRMFSQDLWLKYPGRIHPSQLPQP